MTATVRTPLTQALDDGVITRKELKQLMKRSNAPAFRRLFLWAVSLATTSFLIWLSYDSLWIIPAMFLQGILLVHHFSLQHECCHYTVFKTRKLNDIAGNICGFSIMLPNQHFRYEHCDHHTFTQLKGKDPELIELPVSVWKYLWYMSSIPYWRNKLTEISRHVAGRLSSDEMRFIPKQEAKTIYREARVMVLLYISIIITCIIFGWSAPLYYWLIPVLMAEPVMRAIRLTEHVGRPNSDDLTENTRTTMISKPFQFLCWNMNYHAEHHYASSIPFFALPKLHEKLRGHVYVEPRGYWGAHLDIISQLVGRTPRCDSAVRE